uniref:Uncharacterized protein n=1 Tax=Arundo donax TaxID=35708 RepID=A0A0A9CLC6_ARUDO
MFKRAPLSHSRSLIMCVGDYLFSSTRMLSRSQEA